MIRFLEEFLEPWGPGRRWEFISLDAYAPGLTDNVQRLCWSRGFILVTHGGGASMIAQTSDTDHHLFVRQRFIEKQTVLEMKKARSQGGGLVDLTLEENIDIMAEVMLSKDLHLMATRGFKLTGTTIALDGTEDDMVTREAGVFWKELGMRAEVDAAVADVERRWNEGRLPRTYATVQSLITPYPRRGQLGKLLPGQDDEATPDPDGVPWTVDDRGPGGSEHDDDSDENECGLLADDADCDPDDWMADGADAIGAEPSVGERCGAVRHGDGSESGAVRHGAGAGAGGSRLSEPQADLMLRHSGRLQKLASAKDIAQDLGGVVGASMSSSIDLMVRAEVKSFRAHNDCAPVVRADMQRLLEEEESAFRAARADARWQLEQRQSKRKAAAELQAVVTALKKARRDARAAESVVVANEAVKLYSLDMLGHGKKHGGPESCRKARFEVMQRVRNVAELSDEQSNDWEFFARAWDSQLSAASCKEWGKIFAETMQGVLDKLPNGEYTALSDFMERETQRVLGQLRVLAVPGSLQ